MFWLELKLFSSPNNSELVYSTFSLTFTICSDRLYEGKGQTLRKTIAVTVLWPSTLNYLSMSSLLLIVSDQPAWRRCSRSPIATRWSGCMLEPFPKLFITIYRLCSML